MASAKKYGPWEIQEGIDEGGMGQVFLVKHSETGQIGAMKRLKNANRIARFRDEVEALKRISHPGVIQVLDYQTETEPFYAVFSYEPGGSLESLSKEELLSIPLAQRISLFEQVCDAIHAAHECGMIHRDIKPDNILLSEDRRTAKVCDFGLVYFEDGERHTMTNEQVGSRFFMPPEFEDGRAESVTKESDIYCLGKLLYYMLTGVRFARERHRESQYDLSTVFADPYMEAFSRVMDLTITTDPALRSDSAKTVKMLAAIGRLVVQERLPIAGVASTYRCVFCKTGSYSVVCTSYGSDAHNSGYKEGGVYGSQMVFLECPVCGNCQRFKLTIGGKDWFPEANESYEKAVRRG